MVLGSPNRLDQGSGVFVCAQCGREGAACDPHCQFAEAPPTPRQGTDPAPGVIVANVRLVRLLGRGGMGEVWEARHLRLDERRVVKFIQAPPNATLRADMLRRFRREAEAHVVLRHPVAPILHDYGVTHDERPYIIMEFIDGQTLKAALATHGPMPAGRALGLVRQIADFLHFAHGRGVVHRDLKPSNLMLVRGPDQRDAVKVLDFGIIKRLDDGPSTVTTGGFIGTVEFAAPEQLDGHAGPASDQFSLGCVLYSLLTGRTPFRRESRLATVTAVLNERPPPPSAIVGHLSAAVDAVVGRLLAKKPTARFTDMAAVADALDRAQQGRDPLDPPTGLDDTQTGPVATAPPPARRHRAPIVIALLVCVIGGLIALTVDWRGSPAPTPTSTPAATAETAAPIAATPATTAPAPVTEAPVTAAPSVAPLTNAPATVASDSAPRSIGAHRAPETAPARPIRRRIRPRAPPSRARPTPPAEPAPVEQEPEVPYL